MIQYHRLRPHLSHLTPLYPRQMRFTQPVSDQYTRAAQRLLIFIFIFILFLQTLSHITGILCIRPQIMKAFSTQCISGTLWMGL